MLNIWLNKALKRCQKSIVEFRHFLCLYMIYIDKKVVCRKCMSVCLSVWLFVCLPVCLFVCLWVANFLLRDNTMKVAPITMKFCMDIFTCFFKNHIDFGDDLTKIVVFRLYCHFCVIWTKCVFRWIFETQSQMKISNNHQ